MLNRANKRFRNTFTSGATADDARAEPGQFDPMLTDGEGVHHVCSSGDGIEHETDTRTTTMEPGADADAHLLVTDRRVLGALGDGTGAPEFTFDAAAIDRATGRDGLLSSTLEVATGTATVRIRPDDGTDVEAVAGAIDRVARAWRDLETALSTVETAIEEYENRVADGADPDSALTNVRSRLSRAHHCATREEFAPEGAMLAEVEPVAERVDRLRVTTRLDRAEDRLDSAAAARSDDPAAAVEAAMAAGEELTAAREIHGEVGSTSISQRLTDLTERLDGTYGAVLDDARECCAVAAEAPDSETALARWETALERYRALLDAGWDGEAGVSAAAVRYQLAWIVGNRVDALRERAAELEAEGDEADDSDAYEVALDRRREAREIEAQCPFGEPATGTDAIDRLEEKIARSEWQWGEA